AWSARNAALAPSPQRSHTTRPMDVADLDITILRSIAPTRPLEGCPTGHHDIVISRYLDALFVAASLARHQVPGVRSAGRRRGRCDELSPCLPASRNERRGAEHFHRRLVRVREV